MAVAGGGEEAVDCLLSLSVLDSEAREEGVWGRWRDEHEGQVFETWRLSSGLRSHSRFGKLLGHSERRHVRRKLLSEWTAFSFLVGSRILEGRRSGCR